MDKRDVSELRLCATCRWWSNAADSSMDPASELAVRDPITYELVDPQPFELRVCTSPKVRFYERPERDGAAVVDGSEYFARLVTGPEFGCARWEAANT